MAGFALGAGVVMVLIFAPVFSIAFGTRQIAAHTDALHSADEALRATTVVRAQTGMAARPVTLESEFGFSADDAVGLSIDEAELALSDLRVSLNELGEVSGDLDARLREVADSFDALASSILALAAEGGFGGRSSRAVTGSAVIHRAATHDCGSQADEARIDLRRGASQTRHGSWHWSGRADRSCRVARP